MKKIITVGYSNKIGGAGRALGRWEELLVNSKKLQVIPFHFDEHIYNRTRLAQKWDFFASKTLTHAESYFGRIYNYSDNGIISLNILPTFFGRHLIDTNADFVNLHWINNEMLSISQIKRIKHKVIWTLHDPWLINGLGNYPQSRVTNKPFEKLGNNLQLLRKKGLLNHHVKFIAPSEWIANLFISRGILQDNIRVIPNPIPFYDFYPINVDELRVDSEISESETCVLLGSDTSIAESRKGMDTALQILEKVASKIDVRVITFGPDKDFKTGLKTTNFGYVKNNFFLNQIYNLADITLLPSRMDNLPQVMTESISSGTPVFALPHGDASKFLVDEIGCCAPSRDVSEAATYFLNYVSKISDARRASISQEARRLWDPANILQNYLEFINS